jgi:hypothetical protein
LHWLYLLLLLFSFMPASHLRAAPLQLPKQQAADGPSAFCHATDGAFTLCPDANAEWSDIPPVHFPESNSFLYADQADLDPNVQSIHPVSGEASPLDTFMLMYDECSRTEPFGPDEYFLVNFDTVEVEEGVEKVERYTVHIFADGTIIFFEDGHLETDENGNHRVAAIDGQRGDVGFGPSPTCPFDHVVVEYEIILETAGGESYSPDPLFWGGFVPEPPEPEPCTVTISGSSGTMNVGQLAQFMATVSGGGTPVTYQWSVAGDILKDYSETTNAAWSTTPMAAADFQNQSIAFYWKGPLGSRDVTVNVTAGEVTCSDTETLTVERNSTDINKQAEDFYSSNHMNRILDEHITWHTTFPFSTMNQGGALFFDFHREYISRFNSWRAEFGYPAVGIWDPATPLPTGVAIDHAARTGTTNASHAKPVWFTVAGSASARPSNGLPCDSSAGQMKLADFPANRTLLGCAVESPWHNSVHVAIGGDMAGVDTAPQDPIFWRWHNFVDTVSQDRMGLTPPVVIYQSPFRLFRYISELSAVSVTFSHPVSGVTADDLTVNGSAATTVSGSGAGPYVFTGFAPPALGPVTVDVLPGAIQNDENEEFQGTSWSHILIDPALDADEDEVNDGEEVRVHLTNPTKPDTEEDGLPDGFEIRFSCLAPLIDQAHPHDMVGNPLPGDDDADDDGLTDLEEFEQGSNPCRFTGVSGILDNKGREFILAFLLNFDGAATLELHLTSDFSTEATVEYPVNDPTFVTTVPVHPGEVTIVPLPASAGNWILNSASNNAVRVSAAQEIVAYMVNRRPASSDAALALPVETMNTEYIVQTYNAAFGGGEFNVYAAFDNTTVTITPKNALVGHPAGVPFEVSLDFGEGIHFRSQASAGELGSLTGTTISADRPVGLVNGNICTQIPFGAVACDHIFEVGQPVQSWGTDVLVANLPQRPNGSIYRISASQDNTTVVQDGVVLGTLDRGEFMETPILPGSHRFTADKPIFVTQFMTGIGSLGAVSGDPAMGNMIPFDQYLSSYTFSTVGGNQFATNYVTIIAENDDLDTIEFDNAPIGAGNFTPIAGTDFSSAVLPLASGTHSTFSHGVHGITVEGFNSADSYLYPGGARFQFINPVGDANAPLVVLTPAPGQPPALNGTATDDRPSEDTNNNGVLDPGEDLNDNGQIDADTGIFFVELDAGSTNLLLTVDPFVPGDGTVNFVVTLEDAEQTGSGVVRVTDGAGNAAIVPVQLPLDQVSDRDADSIADELDNCPATPNTDQLDSNLNGLGDACETPDTQLSTAGFLQARLDGSTTAAPHSLTVADEPDSAERLQLIVDFRIAEGLTDSPQQLAQNLVASLVATGLVPPEEADDLVDELLSGIPEPVNTMLRLDKVSTAYNPTPVANAPAGVYTIEATFTNISATTLSDLFFQVTTLTGDNVLLNAIGGPAGVGAQLEGPDSVAPGESFVVTFEIGLARRQPFSFFVDAFAFVTGAAAAEVSGPIERFRFEVAEGDLQNDPEPHLFLPFIRR